MEFYCKITDYLIFLAYPRLINCHLNMYIFRIYVFNLCIYARNMHLSKIHAIYEKRKIATMFLESRNEETKNNRKNRPFSSHSVFEPNLVPNDGIHIFGFIFSELWHFLFFGRHAYRCCVNFSTPSDAKNSQFITSFVLVAADDYFFLKALMQVSTMLLRNKWKS